MMDTETRSRRCLEEEGGKKKRQRRDLVIPPSPVVEPVVSHAIQDQSYACFMMRRDRAGTWAGRRILSLESRSGRSVSGVERKKTFQVLLVLVLLVMS